jgi:membrane protease YdiL (CAAX protease family)
MPSRARAFVEVVVVGAVLAGLILLPELDAVEAVLTWIPRAWRVPAHVWVMAQVSIVLVATLASRDEDMAGSLGLTRKRLAGAFAGGVLLWGGILVTATSFAVAAVAAQHVLEEPLVAAGRPGGLLPNDIAVVREFARIPVLAVVPLAMYVGFYEELIFRGFMLGRLRILFGDRALGAVLAIGLSSALFALGHTYKGALGVAATFLLGVTFGVVAWRQRSITTCVVAHAMLDAFVLLSLHVAQRFVDVG